MAFELVLVAGTFGPRPRMMIAREMSSPSGVRLCLERGTGMTEPEGPEGGSCRVGKTGDGRWCNGRWCDIGRAGIARVGGQEVEAW